MHHTIKTQKGVQSSTHYAPQHYMQKGIQLNDVQFLSQGDSSGKTLRGPQALHGEVATGKLSTSARQ